MTRCEYAPSTTTSHLNPRRCRMDPLPWYRIAATPIAMISLAVFAYFRPNPRVNAALLGATLMSAFGVGMDQVSARLCPEYFTVLHNPIPGLTSPTLVGLVWGVLGAAGGGLIFGYAAGLAATAGPLPPWPVRRLVRPMLLTVVGVGTVVAITGLGVWHTASGLGVRLDGVYAEAIPPERHAATVTVASYHVAAYLSSIAGSVALCLWVGTRRGQAKPVSAACGGTPV